MDIETRRLCIRPFAPGDAGDLYEILGDAEVMEYGEPPYDRERTERFLADFCIKRGGALAAAQKDSGKVIGYILFNDLGGGVYEMGWFFNRRYWRRGYAFESCAAVIDYAFDTLHAHKIFAETIDTVRSAGMMKKLGMHREGVQRSQARDNRGNWADVHLYGLLESDRWGGEQ